MRGQAVLVCEGRAPAAWLPISWRVSRLFAPTNSAAASAGGSESRRAVRSLNRRTRARPLDQMPQSRLFLRSALVVCSPCRSVPADNGRGEPNGRVSVQAGDARRYAGGASSVSSAMPNWAPGETIHFGHRTVRVVTVRDDDADRPPVLVVEEA
jgi:hypothetical protein